jgi:hypothetical protein
MKLRIITSQPRPAQAVAVIIKPLAHLSPNRRFLAAYPKTS